MSSALEYYIPGYATSQAPLALAIFLVVTTAFVIFGGAHRISFMTSVIVPVMAIAYITLALWITATHLDALPAVFSLIFSSAFDFQSIFGGFAGSVIVIGIKRGLFSNEAGMGSAPNAAAAASVSHPVKQGLAQTLSVFIDTLIICSCTSMMVLVFFVGGTPGELNGMPLVQQAVSFSVGELGIHFITFSVFAFAFSSLIVNYFYAESNIRFIKDNKVVLFIFRITCLLAIFLGAQANFDLAWNIADIVMGAMAFMNIISIVLLGKWALKALDDYMRQRKLKQDPVFIASSIEGLPKVQCWQEVPHDMVDIAGKGAGEKTE
jgi:AGCS family alanine or glycine:cation symporter